MTKEMKGYRKLKQKALIWHSMKTRFGWGYGPVARQTKEWTGALSAVIT